jgi:hypothetical protein
MQRFMNQVGCVCGLSIFFLTLMCSNAHAYIDPGSGSHLFQVLIASLLAALYGIKVYWLKITAYFQRLFKKSGR